MLEELRNISEKLDVNEEERPTPRHWDRRSDDAEDIAQMRRKRYGDWDDEDEEEDDEEYPRPHFRLPGLISQGVEGAARGVASAADATRRGLAGVSDATQQGVTGAARGFITGLTRAYQMMPQIRRPPPLPLGIQAERDRIEEEQLNIRYQQQIQEIQ